MIENTIKDFLQNPNNQNLIDKNDWKSILLGDILNGGFSTFESFCQIMRSAGIPIDSYFDKVFDNFEIKKQLTKNFFGNEREWEFNIVGSTEREFHLEDTKENATNITYSNLYSVFKELQNLYNIDLFPSGYNLNEPIQQDDNSFKIISNIQIDVDNTYLIYRIEVYKEDVSKFAAYKYMDTLGRIIPGYGYGYNLSEFDKLNSLILHHLQNWGLKLK